MLALFPQVCLRTQGGLWMGPPESNSTRADFHGFLYLENEFYSSQRFGVPEARMDGFVPVVSEKGLVDKATASGASTPINMLYCWKELHA